MVIGITGQIGSGKSTAAGILQGLGAVVIDADRIGHQVVRQSAPLRKKLAKVFGRSILDKHGQVKRKKLAALAFVDETSKQKLNRLVHPYLLKVLRRRVNTALKKHDLVVIDAALLLYWNMDREVDYVLVVHASRQTRFARLAKRGISRSDAAARQRAQLPYAEFRHRADRVILNNSSIKALEIKIKLLLSKIVSAAH